MERDHDRQRERILTEVVCRLLNAEEEACGDAAARAKALSLPISGLDRLGLSPEAAPAAERGYGSLLMTYAHGAVVAHHLAGLPAHSNRWCFRFSAEALRVREAQYRDDMASLAELLRDDLMDRGFRETAPPPRGGLVVPAPQERGPSPFLADTWRVLWLFGGFVESVLAEPYGRTDASTDDLCYWALTAHVLGSALLARAGHVANVDLWTTW